MTAKIDLVGRKFGRLTVIEDAGRNKKWQVLWRCRCDCGKEIVVHASGLKRSNRADGCGDHRIGHRLIDLTGQRFGRLIVLSQNGRSRRGRVLWLCLCNCGKQVTVQSMHLVYRHTQSCGCLQKEAATRAGKYGRKRTLAPGRAMRNIVLKQYQNHAKTRGFLFDLSEEEYDWLARQPCFYCGSTGSPYSNGRNVRLHGQYIANGIDRLDNSQGYTRNNCVPCCWMCNKKKGTTLAEDFIAWIHRCHEHLKDRFMITLATRQPPDPPILDPAA